MTQRLLHVLPRLIPGGIPTLIEQSFRRLRGLGYEVFALAFEGAPELAERWRSAGIELRIDPRGGSRPRDVGSVVAIRDAVADFGPSWVHSHTRATNFHSALALLRPPAGASVRLVSHFHGINPKATALHTLADAVIRRRSDRILACSQFVFAHEGLGRVGPGRASVLFNGVELPTDWDWEAARASVDAEFDLDQSAFLVVSVARLEWRKDMGTLVRATALPRMAGTQVLIVGDGRDGDELRRLAADLRLGNRLILAGRRLDVSRLLAAADVFALTSLTEGLGLVLLEAMAHRLPIVATRVGGVCEVLRPEYARTIPVRSPEAVAEGVYRWRVAGADSRTRAGLAARRRVERDFSMDGYASRLAELYESLV